MCICRTIGECMHDNYTTSTSISVQSQSLNDKTVLALVSLRN